MLKEIVDFLSPNSVVEAHDLLLKYSPESAVVGGGVDLIWRGRKGIKFLISLEKLPLKFISKNNGFLEIGAMTTIRDLIESHPEEIEFPDFLKPSLKCIATPLLRGVITIGGALARAYPWGDLPPIFLGLESKIELFDGEEKIFSLPQFYEGDFREVLKKAIITKILIPINPGRFCSYRRFTRTAVDIPLFNQIVSLEFEKELIKRARVFTGARPGFPQRELELEEFLEGKILDDDLIIKAAELARETVKVESDFRLSKEFRKHISGVFFEENLREIKGKHDCQFQA